MNKTIRVGSLVVSNKGRDKGINYIVLSIDYKNNIGIVKLANGKNKTIANPKIKNVKHVTCLDYVAENISLKIENQIIIFDQEIQKILRVYQASLVEKVEE